MKGVKLQLTKEQEEFLSANCNRVHSGGKLYSFIPFWFEHEEGSDMYTPHLLGEVPKELEKYIMSVRDSEGVSLDDKIEYLQENPL